MRHCPDGIQSMWAELDSLLCQLRRAVDVCMRPTRPARRAKSPLRSAITSFQCRHAAALRHKRLSSPGAPAGSVSSQSASGSVSPPASPAVSTAPSTSHGSAPSKRRATPRTTPTVSQTARPKRTVLPRALHALALTTGITEPRQLRRMWDARRRQAAANGTTTAPPPPLSDCEGSLIHWLVLLMYFAIDF